MTPKVKIFIGFIVLIFISISIYFFCCKSNYQEKKNNFALIKILSIQTPSRSYYSSGFHYELEYTVINHDNSIIHKKIREDGWYEAKFENVKEIKVNLKFKEGDGKAIYELWGSGVKLQTDEVNYNQIEITREYKF